MPYLPQTDQATHAEELNKMQVPVKHCKFCDGVGHTTFNCPKRKRDPLKMHKKFKNIGKYSRRWGQTRRKWYKQNPPDHAGYYYCALKLVPECLRAMAVDQTTLDHIKSRSRNPELRYELDNLQPACLPCNSAKSSLSKEEFLGLQND